LIPWLEAFIHNEPVLKMFVEVVATDTQYIIITTFGAQVRRHKETYVFRIKFSYKLLFFQFLQQS